MITSRETVDDCTRLESLLGYRFKDKNTLIHALSHRSYSEVNNERLEFLGDSIINFLIGEFLYNRYPNENEGNLSRLRSCLVRKQSLYEVGIDLSLSDFVLLGHGELRANGHKRQSLIADCVEAITAAVFLDSRSIEQCRDCVLLWFNHKLDDINSLEHLKDAKTRLQEYVQSKHKPLPTYEIMKVDGSGHELIFHVCCNTSVYNQKVTGSGSSRRKAEQDAAKNLLTMLKNCQK